MSRRPRVGRNEGEGAEPDYPLLSRSLTLDQPTDDGAVVRDAALRLWDEAAVSVPVRLLGVSLSNLQHAAEAVQLDLFGVRQKADRLGPALDQIRERFGDSAIRRAVVDPEKTTLSNRRK